MNGGESKRPSHTPKVKWEYASQQYVVYCPVDGRIGAHPDKDEAQGIADGHDLPE